MKAAIDKHANHNTAELDRSRPVRKRVSRRRRFGEQVVVNMHTMGTSFVGKVRDICGRWQTRRMEREGLT